MSSSKNVYLRYQSNIPLNGFRCSLDQTNQQLEWMEIAIGCTIGKTVPVKHITVSIPLGTDQATTMGPANYLTFNYDAQDLFLVKQTSPGVFYITAADGKSTIQWNLQALNIRLTGIVMNTTPGVFKIKVTENSASPGSSNYEDRTGWRWFGKYPYQFFMRNLVAGASSVKAGESVHLSWIGTQMGKYTMNWYDANGPQSADVTDVRNWQSPPLQQDTVFELVGVANTPGALTQSLHATVFVQDSVLAGSGLRIDGDTVSLNCGQVTGTAYANDSGPLISFPFQHQLICQQFIATTSGTVKHINLRTGSVSPGNIVQPYLGPGTVQGGFQSYKLVQLDLRPNTVNTLFPSADIQLVAGQTYVFSLAMVSGTGNFELGTSSAAIPGAMLSNAPANQNLMMDVILNDGPPQGLTVTPAGLVGIANSSPAFALDVAGTIQATKVQETSDIRLKQNIHPLTDALAQLLQLRGVGYDRRDTGKHEIGLIAQEVEQVFPELVERDAQGLGSVAYTRLTAILVEAVKAMQGEIADLRAELRKLKGEE